MRGFIEFIMKKRIFSILVLCGFLPVCAVAQQKSVAEAYIEKYAQAAVDEMFRSGVPASITLAQGMLESANGQSYLATEGNNHFGIKCHDWKGPGIYKDAERKGECFRKYKSVSDSYRDHSDFLRYRDRYKFLFDLDITDYKGWAHGLKKAGYATDPAYPRKLINLIETYGLDRYDQTDTREIRKSNKLSRKEARKKRKAEKAAAAAALAAAAAQTAAGNTVPQEVISVTVNDKIPEAPSVLEEPKPYRGIKMFDFSFSLSRQLYSVNGVPFVYSVAGETYQSIADQYDLFLKEILSFNDAGNDMELLPGTVVYLQRKKRKASSHVDKYITEGMESLRDVSQRFAVRLKSLRKINGFSEDHILKPGDTILLR